MAKGDETAEKDRLIPNEEERTAVGACTKYFLFFINFIFVICGGAVAGLSTYILVLKSKRVDDVLDFFLDPACDLCLAGCVTLVVAFFGCLGALREILCCLKTYHYCLWIILLVEFTLAILMFVSYYVPDVKDVIFPSDTFKQAIADYRDDPDMQHLIDTLQEDLQCCGLSDSEKGFYDWNENIYFNCSTENISPEKCSVPHSCCRIAEGEMINYNCGANMFIIMSDGSVTANDANLHLIYTDGCIRALGDWINDHALIVGGVMLGVLLPQMFLLYLSRNLIDQIRIQKSKW